MITSAMIMAAGLGQRMRPITNTIPKPLVKVGGKALIDHVIDRLTAGGVTMIVVNVHYLGQQIVDHLKTRKDVEIHISDESDALLDSGGGIRKAIHHFKGQPFFHATSDTVWTERASAIGMLNARWNPKEMDALMLLVPTANTVCYEGRGDFHVDAQGHIGVTPGEAAPFVNMGIEILHPRLFDGTENGKFSIWPLWRKAIESKRMYGVALDGVWMHVDSPEAVGKSEAYLSDRAKV
jgi:MurNAc alpha-1-phosphate uridylyltransferase